jgi:hypothetical protein
VRFYTDKGFNNYVLYLGEHEIVADSSRRVGFLKGLKAPLTGALLILTISIINFKVL